MRVTYDPSVDAAYIYLTNEQLLPGRNSVPAQTPEGVWGTVVLDWKDGRIVGLEILGASAHLRQDLLAAAELPGEPAPG